MRPRILRKRASAILTILSSVLLMTCWGCGTRIILQRPGTAVTLTQEVRGAHVMAPDKSGNLVPGTVDLPAGTVCGVPDVQPKR